MPRKSKDQTLPISSGKSFTWIIPKTILCLVLDFQGMVNSPLIRPYFLGGGGIGGVPLDSMMSDFFIRHISVHPGCLKDCIYLNLFNVKTHQSILNWGI